MTGPDPTPHAEAAPPRPAREAVRVAVLDAAERAVAAGGLPALKAREVAREAGCAVGAIYNAFPDLDALVFAVNARTLVLLDAALGEVARGAEPEGAEAAIARLRDLSAAYLDFAADHAPRWRGLFAHALPEGREVPEWYALARAAPFARMAAPLAVLLPGADGATRALLARSLFSAVHGVVALGLDQKLVRATREELHGQLAFVAEAIGRGMAREHGG